MTDFTEPLGLYIDNPIDPVTLQEQKGKYNLRSTAAFGNDQYPSAFAFTDKNNIIKPGRTVFEVHLQNVNNFIDYNFEIQLFQADALVEEFSLPSYRKIVEALRASIITSFK